MEEGKSRRRHFFSTWLFVNFCAFSKQETVASIWAGGGEGPGWEK